MRQGPKNNMVCWDEVANSKSSTMVFFSACSGDRLNCRHPAFLVADVVCKHRA